MKAKNAFVSRFGLSSLADAIALALAEGGAAQSALDPSLEEITVTGTRIRATDGMAEPVPVTTLSIEELSLYDPGSTIAEQLDALPQFFNTGTAQRGGPAFFGDGGGRSKPSAQIAHRPRQHDQRLRAVQHHG
jgi:outer membrane receptor protein involved in Fe transport